MVDAPFDEGMDGFMAADQPAMDMPAMQMQAQTSVEDAFADASFPSSQPTVTIQTASGAAQNLDDDLTEEEKEICAAAAAHQDELKAGVHNKMMSEAMILVALVLNQQR